MSSTPTCAPTSKESSESTHVILRAAIVEPKSLHSLFNQRNVLSDFIHKSSETVILAVSNLPAVALSQLLSSLYSETCHRKPYQTKEDSIQSPANFSTQNNLHSILKFIERIVKIRYSPDWDNFVINDRKIDENEEWILCIVFIVAFKAIFVQNLPDSTKNNLGQLSQETKATKTSKTAHNALNSSNQCLNCVDVALEILKNIREVSLKIRELRKKMNFHKRRYQSVQDHAASNKKEKVSVLHECFPLQIERLDQYIKQHTKRHESKENINDENKIMVDHDELSETSSVESPHHPKRKRLKKIDSIFHSKKSTDATNKILGNDYEHLNDIVDDCSKHSDQDEVQSLSQKSNLSASTQVDQSSAIVSNEKSKIDESPPNNSLPFELTEPILKLRESLILNLKSQTAMSSEDIIDVTERINQFLNRCISLNLGAKGINMVGDLLAFGQDYHKRKTESSPFEKDKQKKHKLSTY